MHIFRLVASQLRQPEGRLGRFLTTRLLDYTNGALIDGVIAALCLVPEDHYLDVGFGGGRSLRQAAKVLYRGHVYGVDTSDDVIAEGRRRHRELIAAGRMTLLHGRAADLPLPDTSVGKISSVHSIYFWPDLDAGFREIARVLKPGGRLAIGFSDARKMERFDLVTRHGMHRYGPDEIVQALEAAGFIDVESFPIDDRSRFNPMHDGDHVVLARRPRRPSTAAPPPEEP